MTVIELTSEQLAADVHPVLHELRATEPVVWVPSIERWLVTGRDLVVEALRDPVTFTVDDERFTTAQVVGPSMLSLDGDEHARHRDPFAFPFRRSATIQNFAARTTEIAKALVAQLDDGTDLRAGLAAPLAAETIGEALGLVDTTTPELLGWYRQIVAAVEAVTVGDTPAPSVAEAFDQLAAAVERTRVLGGSLLADIDSVGELTPAELHSNTAVMLFGAIETSEGMTANALHHVLSEPGLVAALQADRALIDNAVEESLRLEPAATLVDRYVTTAVEFGGVELPAEAPVALSLAAANRDPAHFDDPDRFDLHRPNAAQHLAFVHGPHACIGMHLARLETAAALNAVLDRWPSASLRSDAPPPTGLVFRKPESVPLRDPALNG